MKPYYSHGGISIYHGDCREVLPGLTVKADLLLTDPPYAVSVPGAVHVGQPGRGRRNLDFFKGDCDWQATVKLAADAVALALHRITPEGSAYVWCGHRQFGALTEHLEAAGWSTRFLVWSKQCPPPPPPGAGWPSGAELCVYAYRPGRVWTARKAPQSNVLVYDGYRYGNGGKVEHPTQKPLRLFSRLIDLSSRDGQTVLDCFMGSGTSLLAAKGLGRRAIGIEIEERYCELAANRLSQEVLEFAL